MRDSTEDLRRLITQPEAVQHEPFGTSQVTHSRLHEPRQMRAADRRLKKDLAHMDAAQADKDDYELK